MVSYKNTLAFRYCSKNVIDGVIETHEAFRILPV